MAQAQSQVTKYGQEELEVERAQNAMLDSLKDNKEFDAGRSLNTMVKPIKRQKH